MTLVPPEEVALAPGQFRVDYDGPNSADPGNLACADGVGRRIVVTADAGDKTKFFHRTQKRMGAKVNSGELPATGRVFMAELDGVRLYVQGGTLILTKRDLYF